MNPRFFGLGLVLVLLCAVSGGGSQAQTKRYRCAYTEEPHNPFIVSISDVCGNCGIDLCLGRVDCQVEGSSFTVSTTAYCPIVRGTSECPDATKCSMDPTIGYRDVSKIMDASQSLRSDSEDMNR